MHKNLSLNSRENASHVFHGLSCSNEEIKKFSRAIYEIKDPNTNYLTYDLSTLKTSKTKLVYDFYDDIDFY